METLHTEFSGNQVMAEVCFSATRLQLISTTLFFERSDGNVCRHQRTPKYSGSVRFSYCEVTVRTYELKPPCTVISVGQNDFWISVGTNGIEVEIEETL